jgi:cysteine desulfurase family protein
VTTPVYLDHAATSFPKAPGVARAVATFLETSAGNPGRGGHRLTVAASRAVEEARDKVASLLGAEPERTLLGPGCTYWLNTLLLGLLRPGDRVVCSALEHNAVMRPLRWLERERGVVVHVLQGADPHGVPTAGEAALAVMAAPTRLVVMTHASNVSGAVLPVAEVARAVAPVPVVVDAAQTAGSVPFLFRELGVAALVCSGHKGLLGPPGVGVLLLDPGFSVPPLVRGGTGSRSESEWMPDLLPDLLEAGTPNTPGIVGLGASCAWLQERGVAEVHAAEMHLVVRAVERLGQIPGLEILGFRPGAPRTGTVSFRVRGLDLGEMTREMDAAHGIQLRHGLHCAPAAHRQLGTFPGGTLRASLGPFNTRADVDRLADAVELVSKRARR